jgi:transposase-like protein
VKYEQRDPTPQEGLVIRDLYNKGLGSPKISQLVGISSYRVLNWLRNNGLTRTREEMIETRRANGINFNGQTVPKKSFQL